MIIIPEGGWMDSRNIQQKWNE